EQIHHSQHTRLPVFRDNINHVEGFLHIKNVLHLLAQERFTLEALLDSIRDAYFVPETTQLNTQLLNFQQQERRIGLAVDEYGDVQGLVTLEDILEEIVGKFTSEAATTIKDVHPQKDGSFLVDGSANIRDLNRMMKWNLPVHGAKTFNGLITEYLESIPAQGISVKIADHPIEIVQIQGNTVKTARIFPKYKNKG
ncbi:MAG TPA: magnesium/cobalt efflux protein, partial [Gammaproteobacteria bacterium]|nr:magnesium/cobalt efflux protein [Gammaproteobacteria bacterium]